MEIPKIHEGEYRFCLILWEHGPIAAAQLARLCQDGSGPRRIQSSSGLGSAAS